MGIRDKLKGAARKTVEVDLGELGKATLREMSGTERDDFESASFSETDGKRAVNTKLFRARLVALCLVENEKRVYSDDEIQLLSDQTPFSVLDALFIAAQKLNGLDAAAVENAAKNSSGDRNAPSTSGLPST